MQLSLGRSTGNSPVPYVLWAYSVGVAPLAYMASKEDDDNIATTIGMYFAQLAAIGLGLSVIISGGLLWGVALVLLMSITVPFINLMLIPKAAGDSTGSDAENETTLLEPVRESAVSTVNVEADLWVEFRGRGNSPEILAKKAAVLCSLIFDCSMQNAYETKELCRNLCEADLSDHQFYEAFLEFNSFYLHYVDRIAYATLDEQSREYFLDQIVERNKKAVIGLYDESVNRAQLEASYTTTYNNRQSSYGNCAAVYPEKNEALKGTLYWEFSKLVSEKVGMESDARIITATMKQIMLARPILEIEAALQCR